MKKLLSLNTFFYAAVITVLIIFIAPKVLEFVHVQMEGLHYFTQEMDTYYYTTSKIDEEHTVKIDLNDLESNKGKILFNDNDNKIFVSKVTQDKTNYEVLFRSKGNYTVGMATLVSGMEYLQENKDDTDKL